MATPTRKAKPVKARKPTASGEGERRAMRGYVPQYALAAKVLYPALTAGILQWIGVADRNAGSFDDLVLGLVDRIEAYQVKTSATPGTFSIRTLMLGATGLLSRMIASVQKLKAEGTELPIETWYATDDLPSDTDDVSNGAGQTSAAFIRTHEAFRAVWSLSDWASSPFADFISALKTASGLPDSKFETLLKNMRFLVAGEGRRFGFSAQQPADTKRLSEIAAILPVLVADQSNQDRWTISELLERLNWHGPFELRHSHRFPVDALYEENEVTQVELLAALETHSQGYLSLVGPPGTGKSTLLAAGLLTAPRAIIVRYTAFVPSEGQGIGRAEAFDFLHDLIKQFKAQGLGHKLYPGADLAELRHQFQAVLEEAGQRYAKTGVRSLVVVDGLDHVSREERPAHSLLAAFPLPAALPDGVVFILGTQRLDLPDVPPQVSAMAGQEGRKIPISPLSRQAVARLCDLADLPEDVDREIVARRSEGHPLSTRYLISGLLNLNTADARQSWLTAGPSYGGDVDAFYESAWHGIEGSPDAIRGLAYLALIDGSISLAGLDLLVGSSATDAMIRASKHLLRLDDDGTWSIFHNSFRLFLRSKTSVRHGLPDEANVRARYQELAALAAKAPQTDPQRWHELRYSYRAGNHQRVVQLAGAARFREEFIQGRSPRDTSADMDFGLRSAGELRQPDLVLEILLARHELNRRCEAYGDEIVDAWIELGEFETARSLVQSDAMNLSNSKGWEIVDAYLDTSDGQKARELFQALEPIDELLGSERLKLREKEASVPEWAARALAFRTPEQFLTTIERLQKPHDPFEKFDSKQFKIHLKLEAARGQLDRDFDRNISQLVKSLRLPTGATAAVHYFAAMSAYRSGDSARAVASLAKASRSVNNLRIGKRRYAALVAANCSRLDLAAIFFAGLTPPTFEVFEKSGVLDGLDDVARNAFEQAKLAAWLGLPSANGEPCTSTLMQGVQTRIERLGSVVGTVLAGSSAPADISDQLRNFVDYIKRAQGPDPTSSDRWRIDRGLPELMTLAVEVAWIAGGTAFERLVKYIDGLFENEPGRLEPAAVRSAYVLTVFKHDRDAEGATKRLTYVPLERDTPNEQLAEAAIIARAFVRIGALDRARTLLLEMHQHGLGWARAARKDPQYILWEDFFLRANQEAPDSRPDRLIFMSRLLAGMSATEGHSAALRLTRSYLKEASKTSTAWARAAAAHAQEHDLADWVKQVAGLTLGVSDRNPEFTQCATAIFGRLGLPYADDDRSNRFPEFIALAPDDQVTAVVQSAVQYLETDCRRRNRISYISQVVDAAASRKIRFETDPMERWWSELPKPRSGNSPEDPFFLVQSLAEAADIYKSIAGETGKWNTIRAFERLAPLEGLQATKAFLRDVPTLEEDERSLEVAATVAISEGDQASARLYLSKLAILAREKNWGSGLQGPGKAGYYRIAGLLDGAPARQEAFIVFVDDMASRREFLDYLIGDLADVMELIEPRPSWTRAWEVLAAQIREFRDYKIGADVLQLLEVEDTEAKTLAHLIVRGIASNIIDLEKNTASLCTELIGIPRGAEVVADAVVELISMGADSAVSGLEIAWARRDNTTVRRAVEPLLGGLCKSKDAGVGRIAQLLAKAWNKECAPETSALGFIYSMILPNQEAYYRFDEPSGLSDSYGGFQTNEPLSWTWPLRHVLAPIARHSGVNLANLRFRAGQIMSQTGGLERFGPEAIKGEARRHRQLHLLLPFKKLSSLAAFEAVRIVVAELVAAGTLPLDWLPVGLPEMGANTTTLRRPSPSVRPRGIGAVDIDDHFYKKEWLDDASPDLLNPNIDGFRVLAATTVHRRGLWAEEREVFQYYGPKMGEPTDEFLEYVYRLPELFAGETIVPMYPNPVAPGAVVRVRPDLKSTLSAETPLLCPRLVARLEWTIDVSEPFTWRDRKGEIAARTTYWRDGGQHSHETDRDTVGYGYVLTVANHAWADVKPFLMTDWVSIAWRIDRNVNKSEVRVSIAKTEFDGRG